MPSKKLKTPVLPDKYYHIFNRANNNELIFKEHEDFQLFLTKLGELVTDKIDIYCFCLMPNHFHMLIKPKYDVKRKGEGSFIESLKKLFQMHVQYFNKKYQRKGSLFYKSYRRIEIKDESYLKYLVFYIHYNAQKANLVPHYYDYQYSSYRFFLNNKETKLRKDVVLSWFDDDINEFEIFHKECLEWLTGKGTPALGLESLLLLPLSKSQPL
jgi:REP element-mobilizing transposase RayT